ncbi:MAG: MBL fold metallo-hydrolase [Candidatus Heimdallarchaeota archaeon]|nr:MAG: MBL fold metallo-hydrolase [Candidatus Heimdallarchaeota archaeon]
MELDYKLNTITPHIAINNSMIRSGNISGIILNNYAVIVDTTSYRKTAELFRQKLEKKFEIPVSYLIYTHYHGDHIFGAPAFKDIPIIGSEKTLQNLTNRDTLNPLEEWKLGLMDEEPELAKGIEIILPSICFQKQYFLRDDNLSLEIHHSGGHTSGSSYVYFPEEKALFTGDLIFQDIYPYAGDPTCNPDMWIAQLENFQKMDIETIIPGHGSILKGREALNKHIAFYKSLKTIVLKALNDNETVDAIKAPDFFPMETDIWKPIAVEYWYNFYRQTD